jgi:hypothetical protein
MGSEIARKSMMQPLCMLAIVYAGRASRHCGWSSGGCEKQTSCPLVIVRTGAQAIKNREVTSCLFYPTSIYCNSQLASSMGPDCTEVIPSSHTICKGTEKLPSSFLDDGAEPIFITRSGFIQTSGRLHPSGGNGDTQPSQAKSTRPGGIQPHPRRRPKNQKADPSQWRMDARLAANEKTASGTQSLIPGNCSSVKAFAFSTPGSTVIGNRKINILLVLCLEAMSPAPKHGKHRHTKSRVLRFTGSRPISGFTSIPWYCTREDQVPSKIRCNRGMHVSMVLYGLRSAHDLRNRYLVICSRGRALRMSCSIC